MRKKISILTFLFISISFFSQEKEFQTVLQKISSELKTVENSKSTFNQSIRSEKLGVVLITSLETTSKGKTIEIVYELNLSDIDKNTIRSVTSKDVITVQMIVKNNQKLIRQTTDNKKINFSNKLFILADNIDNARILSDYLKEIIPISNEITQNRLSLKGYKDRIEWVQNNVTDVSSLDVTYNQKLYFNNDTPGSVTIDRTIVKNKSNKSEKIQFNLSNINLNTVFFKSKNNEFVLNLETKRKLKTIKFFENEEQKNYGYKFEIICSDVENARDLQRVLKDLIPLTKLEFEEKLPKISSIAEGLEIINKKIATIPTKKNSIQQSFSKNSITTFSKKETNSKKQNDYSFYFNFIDINKNDIEINIKGTDILLALKTKLKNKFIKEIENNEPQNYVNKVEIYVSSIDDAYIIEKFFEDIIDLQEKIKKETFNFSNLKAGVEVLGKNIKRITIDKYQYEQNIQLIEIEGINLLKFSSLKISEKDSKELVQEFNLNDINPKSLEIAVSGKKVMVNLATNYQEKIIKTYANGEIKNYTNKVTIFCTDIENARKIKDIIATLTDKK